MSIFAISSKSFNRDSRNHQARRVPRRGGSRVSVKFDPDHVPVSRSQPYPIGCKIVTSRDKKWTAIVRFWNEGDPARCRLCPKGRCSADPMDSTCLLMVRGKVAPKQAELFDATRLSWPEPGSGPEGNPGHSLAIVDL